MIRDIYYGVQIALLILAGCGAYDSWYCGDIAGAIAVIIIIACVMGVYSSWMTFTRPHKRNKTN